MFSQERLDDLALVQEVAVQTPLISVDLPGNSNTVLFKFENFQEIGSFKIRGATLAMSVDESLQERGVVADSGGNHAQAVALAGRRLHVPVRIIMASVVPEIKKAATRSFGANDKSFTIDLTPPTYVDAKAAAIAHAKATGARYLSPYDDEDILRGTATLVPEIWQQLRAQGLPRPDTFHVPVGGGGLIGGIADINAEQGGLFKLYGHGLTGADSAARSLRSQTPQPVIGDPNNLAEGLAVKVIGNCAHQRMLDGKINDIYTSELSEVGKAFRWYREAVLPQIGVNTKDEEAVWNAWPELSSMVAVSGLFKHISETGAHDQTHLVVISGGNADRNKIAVALAA